MLSVVPNTGSLCAVCRAVDLNPLLRPLVDDDFTKSVQTLAEERQVYLEDFSFTKALETKDCPLCDLLLVCGRLSGLEIKHNSLYERVAGRMIPSRLRSSNVDASHQVIPPTSIRCCLRPQFVSKTLVANGPRRSMEANLPAAKMRPKLVHSGQIHVWFHEMRTDRKKTPLKLPDSDSKRPRAFSMFKTPKVDDMSHGSQHASSSADGGLAELPAQGFTLKPSQLHSPSAPLTTYEYESAVASWMLDVVSSSSHDITPTRCLVGGRVNFKLLRSWLEECSNEHQHPNRIEGISVPLSELPLNGILRAINTMTGKIESLQTNRKFAALSYVWGAKKNTKRFIRGGSRTLNEYPATVRDAAKLAQELGIKWLWVDRVCIDQSSEAEKASLIPYIKDIFAAAEFTIVAAAGKDSSHGLPGISSTASREADKPYELRWMSGFLRLLPSAVSYNSMLNASVWRTRGWTFEEMVFSRRILYVFPSEIFFSCASGTFQETKGIAFSKEGAGSTWGDRGRTPPSIAAELHAKLHSPHGLRHQPITAQQYVRAVEEYTTRDLTIEEDRVKAFVGLVAAMNPSYAATQDGSSLLHGHPLNVFETLLTWHHEEGYKLRKGTSRGAFAPSWSWASAKTKVHFLDNGEEHNRNRWFKYTLIRDFDVLGIPIDKNIPLVTNLGLPFPDDIIKERPWEAYVPVEPPKYDQADGHERVLGATTPLPSLHLVTLVFEAVIEPRAEDQHCIRPRGSSRETQARLTGRWSARSEDPPDDQFLPQYVPSQDHVLEDETEENVLTEAKQPARVRRFALIAGFSHMYIMLLEPHVDVKHDPRGLLPTFSRHGILRVSLLGGSASSAIQIMSKGDAQWTHIRLV